MAQNKDEWTTLLKNMSNKKITQRGRYLEVKEERINEKINHHNLGKVTVNNEEG